MSDMKNKITELLSESCKSAPEMTHGFKIIGDGDMKKGVLTVAEYFEEAGMKKGSLIGVAGTLTVIGLIAGVKKLYDINKEHKARGEKIVKSLEQGIVEANEIEDNNEED